MTPLNYLHKAPEFWVPLVVVLALAYTYQWKRMFFAGLVTMIALLLFFRTWRGKMDMDPNAVIVPCDGKVLRIIYHKNSNSIQVAIFLNVHNIHVQYMPCDGVVKHVTHKPGEFHPAYVFEKSALNERTETVLGTRFGDVMVVQLAGLVARRIVSFVEGDKLNKPVYKGEPLGLIKLGSRVDVWLPADKVRIDVVEGQRVHIGSRLATVLAGSAV